MSEIGGPFGEGREVEWLHRTLIREPGEPEDGREPTPWYLTVLIAASLFVGGFYLGRHGATFDTSTHVGWVAKGEGPGVTPELTAAPADGAALYTQRCASCHQADGKGVAGAFPPLVGSEYVAGPPETAIRIVLHGLTGPITVAGATYDGAMPAWGTQMSDAEIAAVLTHVRELAGVQPPTVDPALVTRIRQQTADRTAPWTAAELGGGAP